MIRTLIIEDNSVKASKVEKLLQEEVKPSEINIKVVNNIKGAKSVLYETKYDLIILDLVLPLEDDDDLPQAEKGINFLNDIYENPSIIEPIHIIGLTEYKDLKPQYEKFFVKKRNHLINYQEESYSWKDQLKSILWTLINENREVIYDYDVAIVTATKKELLEVKRLSESWDSVEIRNDATEYKETIFETKSKNELRVIAVSQPEMGMNSAAVLSMKVINNFRPKYLIMTGIAACTQEQSSHGFGDILIFDEVWDGGAGKLTTNEKGEPEFKPEARHLRLDSDIKEKIRALSDDKSLLSQLRENSTHNKPNTVLSAHIGAVASVAGVIENKALISELKVKDRKLLGLEMESYGMFYAAQNCSNPKPKAIAIKSISDFANTEKSDHYQAYASYTSAQFVYKLLTLKLF